MQHLYTRATKCNDLRLHVCVQQSVRSAAVVIDQVSWSMFFGAVSWTTEAVPGMHLQGRCDLPCGAPCRRLPCNQRCTKLLSCGHRCPSLCGEPCPNKKFCIKCGHKDITVRVRSADGFDADIGAALAPAKRKSVQLVCD